jgi:glycosyltransferase involved in cell wall biosynthesis
MLEPGPAAAPPKILHLITGLETGGAEGTLERLVAGIDRGRFAPVVVSMTDAGRIGHRIENAGIPLETLRMRRGAADPRGLWRLFRVLRRHRPAILQTWLYHADLLGLAAHALGCAHLLLWNIRCTEAIEAGAVRAILRRSSATPHAIVVNSAAGRRYHEHLGYRPKRWEFVPNGFDTAVFKPDPAARQRLRGELGIADEAVVIGMSARYHPMKDHATFLAAAARLAARHPQLVLLLAGAGVDRANPDLAQRIAQHGALPPVRLLGERRDMHEVYPAFDIASLTSAFGEGFPNVLGEAMACGVPCIATDSGDAAAVIGPTGEVVPPRDPAALAAAWERLLLAGPAVRQAQGAAARRRIAEHYGLGAMIRRYEALYRDLIEEDNAKPRARRGGW